MNLKKLNPWNWFKHEEKSKSSGEGAPIAVRHDGGGVPASSAGVYDNHPMLQMHREMNRLFDEIWRGFGMPSSGVFNNGMQSMRPSIDVSGDEKQYDISLDVPGYEEDELDVMLQKDMLIIRGRKEQRKEDQDKHYYRVERQYGEFQRVLDLPEDASRDEIRASLKQGVLHLEIPRTEVLPATSRRITISHHD